MTLKVKKKSYLSDITNCLTSRGDQAFFFLFLFVCLFLKRGEKERQRHDRSLCTDVPPPSDKIGRREKNREKSLLPIFSEGGGTWTSVHRLA